MSTRAEPLVQLGWSDERIAQFRSHEEAGLIPGRVVASGAATIAVTAHGTAEVLLQRRFAREAVSVADRPAVGDWLALQPLPGEPPRAALRQILPRGGTFLRHDADSGRSQVLAANLDLAFLVSGLDHDLNLRRLERYLLLAREGGVTPVVVLNKADIALDFHRAVAEVHAVAAGSRVVVTSALRGDGIEELRRRLAPGLTACLLGSSGVGKSTITNALLGEELQLVRDIREDDSHGRHTTTSRVLFQVPGAGLLIDTPGLRSVGVLAGHEAVGATFDDVEAIGRRCRFADCRHDGEPGCAVQAAIAEGRLRPDRLASHRKLEAERRQAELRADERARRAADRRLGRMFKHYKKEVRRRETGHLP